MRELDARSLRRALAVVDPKAVDWSSNDYLGLAAHPAVIKAACQAAKDVGVGAKASRLLSGNSRWHVKLEEELAGFFGAEQAIVFSSGYQANSGILGALLGKEDCVVVDRLCHASLLDGARASPATFRIFQHNDVDHLRQVLSRTAKARRRFVVTEGVFSMDGDSAPLAALAKGADAHDAVLYVDDAHGAFVKGKTGRGSLEEAGLDSRRILYMATLGKALGCQGGFLVGSAVLVDFLRNRSRPFIYATALAIPVVAAAAAALTVAQKESRRRMRLKQNAKRLHARLTRLGLITAAQPSHILPVILGSTQRALSVSRALLKKGHWAPAIRPPTVAEGTARLRLSLTTLHTDKQIDQLVAALRESLSDNVH